MCTCLTALSLSRTHTHTTQFEHIIDLLQDGEFERVIALEAKAMELAESIASSAPGLAGKIYGNLSSAYLSLRRCPSRQNFNAHTSMRKQFNNHEMLRGKGKILRVSQHSRLASTHACIAHGCLFFLLEHARLSVCEFPRFFQYFLSSAQHLQIKFTSKHLQRRQNNRTQMHTNYAHTTGTTKRSSSLRDTLRYGYFDWARTNNTHTHTKPLTHMYVCIYMHESIYDVRLCACITYTHKRLLSHLSWRWHFEMEAAGTRKSPAGPGNYTHTHTHTHTCNYIS